MMAGADKALEMGRAVGYNMISTTKRRVQVMGMTDLQFKSYLKGILRWLDEAKNQETKEQVLKTLEKLEKDLREDLQG